MGAKKHPDTLRAMELWRNGKNSIANIAKFMGIAPSTLYRALFPKGKRVHEKELALRK